MSEDQESPNADSDKVSGDGAPSRDEVNGDDTGEMGAVRRGTRRAVTAGQFVLRGLAISLPPILTLVILIWVLRGIYDYIISPASATVRFSIASAIDESVPVDNLRPIARTAQQLGGQTAWLTDEHIMVAENGQEYVRLGDHGVPLDAYGDLARTARREDLPTSATAFYMAVAEKQYFGSFVTLNLLVLACIVVALYFLGRFVTARIGTWLVHRVETQILGRLPVVRNVYGSVKQVTDFLFSESEVEYRRVVAVEYPRRGIYSLGLVTGESMLEIATFAGEPCVSVLIPSSPMPVTGYTISVPRSAIVDLDLTVDQAFQFCISCGVLVPPQQRFSTKSFQEGLTRRLERQMQNAGAGSNPRSIPNGGPNGDGANDDGPNGNGAES